MKVTREDAISIVDRMLNSEYKGFDDWWIDMMDCHGLYDEENDEWPSIFDVMEAFGISEEEYRKVCK